VEHGSRSRPGIVVVGAGAAGLMAAIFAARAGSDVLVIERTSDGGRKILISGGGRCNVLPSMLVPERFVTDSRPHLLRGMLRSWPLVQQRDFFERDLALPLALEKESGKLFPVSNRARDVRDGLVQLARASGVEFQFNSSLIALEQSEAGWIVHSSRGVLHAHRVIIATGGLSVPSTGSDGSGLQVVESLGHRIHAVYPALTPIVAEPHVHAALSGVSLSVRLRARGQHASRAFEASGGFLFTHRGYSGPSVLDVSHVATRDREAVIRVQWAALSAPQWEQLLARPGALVSSVVSGHVPQRLALQLLLECRIPADRRTSDLRRAERIALIDALTTYVLPWTGNEGFKKAEVTGGGVALEEVDAGTLESRVRPGLYLCGEILDAFGPIGGHNFAWAWATGRLAGLGAARSATT
jgi:predicted Rossmann fold flavoprotein